MPPIQREGIQRFVMESNERLDATYDIERYFSDGWGSTDASTSTSSGSSGSLPSNVFVNYLSNPSTSMTMSYNNNTLSLYGSMGTPVMGGINQRYFGDCYMLASEAEVARQNPLAIQSMITNNGDGTDNVRFYVNGLAQSVTVNTMLPVYNGKWAGNFADGNNWGALIEKAYAQVQALGNITGNGPKNPSYYYGNSYTTIGNAGYARFSLEEVTGATKITELTSNGSTWDAKDYNQLMTDPGTAVTLPTTTLGYIEAALDAGSDLVLGSSTDLWVNGARTLIKGHALSIYGHTPTGTTAALNIYNPWGYLGDGAWKTNTADSYNPTFQVSLNTLLNAADKDGQRDIIDVDNVVRNKTPSGATVIAAPSLQMMSQVESFSVTDTVAKVDSGLSGLIGDSKLTSVTVNGTMGADLLNLTGLNVAAIVNMDGNSDKASAAGFASTGRGAGMATSLNLGSGCDTVALGSGNATIDFVLGSAAGVESIAAFNAAYDLLSVKLNGASLEQTLVGGGDWISSSTDLSHGVFLSGVSSLQSFTVNRGVATIV